MSKQVVLKINIPPNIEQKPYNYSILPGMTYSSEIWTLTETLERHVAAAQGTMERAMIGKSWPDHKANW